MSTMEIWSADLIAMNNSPLCCDLFALEGDFGVYVRSGQGKLESVLGEPGVVRGDDAVPILIHPLPAPLNVRARAKCIAQCGDVSDPLRAVVDDGGQDC